MSIPTRFGILGLNPAFAPDLVVTRNYSLPYGGPTGVGGAFSQGQALGCVQVAAQSEVATLTIGGSPTGGTFVAGFTGDKIYLTLPLAHNASANAFKAALEAAVPEFAGNIAVTLNSGAYAVTFNTNLANQRIGGLFTVNITGLTGGTPTGSWARTTRGSCGLAQMDVYSESANNRVDGFLRYDTTLTPGGAMVPTGVAASMVAAGQPFQPEVCVEGVYKAADLVGLDANAYTLGKLVKVSGGLHVRIR